MIDNITYREQIAKIKTKYADDQKIGITCSCFDLLHPGHIQMLQDAKNQCDILVVALQTDPTIDRPKKNIPIQPYKDRKIMIKAIRYVDEIIEYSTEKQLIEIFTLLKPDIRIIGTDHQGKPFTGDHLPIPIHWHHRNHNWSSTNMRNQVFQAEFDRRLYRG